MRATLTFYGNSQGEDSSFYGCVDLEVEKYVKTVGRLLHGHNKVARRHGVRFNAISEVVPGDLGIYHLGGFIDTPTTSAYQTRRAGDLEYGASDFTTSGPLYAEGQDDGIRGCALDHDVRVDLETGAVRFNGWPKNGDGIYYDFEVQLAQVVAVNKHTDLVRLHLATGQALRFHITDNANGDHEPEGLGKRRRK